MPRNVSQVPRAAVTSAFIHTSRGWIELISAGARLPEPVFMPANSIREEGSAPDHVQKSLHISCSVTPAGILHHQHRHGHLCLWNRLPDLVLSQVRDKHKLNRCGVDFLPAKGRDWEGFPGRNQNRG